MFKTIGITTRRDVIYKKELKELIEFLLEEGKDVSLSMHARKNLNGFFSDLKDVDYDKKMDLLIAFGGDGTILRASRNIKHFSTAILGINGGHLGFLTTIGLKDWKKNLKEILSGKCRTVQKGLFRVVHERNGKVLLDSKVLNDVVVSYKDVARIITIDARVGKRNLCKYSADGLIVSTPTGSTAYNLAAGGPIMYPALKALVITPICSHSFTQKPIVLPSDKKIILTFRDNDELINLTLDGQRSFDVHAEDKVTVEMMKKPLLFVRTQGDFYFKMLKKKLHWGEK